MSKVTEISISRKYEVLMKTARGLFWKHGFRRVTVEEICQRAGISKMTFYKYFSDKLEMAKAIFDQVIQEGLLKFKEILTSDIPPSEKIKKIILLKLEGTNDISKEFMEDFYTDSDSELARFVSTKTLEAWNVVMADIRLAQEKGIFRKDIKPEFMFYFLNNLKPLYTDENLLKLYSSPQELVMEMVNFCMYGISPVKD
ncbi:MAG TPA: TetR/AcrR family transcriptional regulator [Cyclobacteriaceae bacterium]|nr:TetR/AcrR family transcriptional regulator [Cyclobacteriaceae bacterium]